MHPIGSGQDGCDPAILLELRCKSVWHKLDRAVEQDKIIGCLIRPACRERTCDKSHPQVSGKQALRPLGKGCIRLKRDDCSPHLGEKRCRHTRASTDQERALARFHIGSREQPCRCKRGCHPAAAPDRLDSLRIGEGLSTCSNKTLARHGSKGGQQPRVDDSARHELAFDHGSAGVCQ